MKQVIRGRLTAWTAALAFAFTLTIGGCRDAPRRRAPANPTGTAAPSPVVAVVAGVPILVEAVRDQMRARGTDAARALNDLVAFELLARAAAEAGVGAEQRPDAAELEALAAAKVSRFIQREIEPQLAASELPESDIRALYERGKARFVHGRLVQVAVLCVFTGARMKPEPRARAADHARRLKEFVDAVTPVPTTAAAFEAIAKDPAWVDRRVSFTTVWQSEDAPFPPVVGRAAQALRKPGDRTPLVGDETGHYIALYLSERGPENVSFSEAAPALRRDMIEPWRRRRFLQLSLELAEGHAIQIYPENLPLLVRAPPPAPG